MQAYTQQKDLGNIQFKNKNFTQALRIFLTTSQQIQSLPQKSHLKPQSQLSKLYIILLINGAFACINLKTQKKYQQSIELTTKALKIDKNNVKALFRRAISRKELAELLQRQEKADFQHLKQLYIKAKEDFQTVNVLEKTNQLAMQKFKETVKDIYRVTKAQGLEVDLTSGKDQQAGYNTSNKQRITSKTSPYQGNSKKRGMDMQKIMQQYKVSQVSQMAIKKVEQSYLTNQLPATRAQLQKAIRQIQKTPSFLPFIYRFTPSYLNKIQPTFDMLSQLIEVVLQKGQGQEVKWVLIGLRGCKSFGLFWKSLVKKEREQFRKRWLGKGLNDDLQ